MAGCFYFCSSFLCVFFSFFFFFFLSLRTSSITLMPGRASFICLSLNSIRGTDYLLEACSSSFLADGVWIGRRRGLICLTNGCDHCRCVFLSFLSLSLSLFLFLELVEFSRFRNLSSLRCPANLTLITSLQLCTQNIFHFSLQTLGQFQTVEKFVCIMM